MLSLLLNSNLSDSEKLKRIDEIEKELTALYQRINYLQKEHGSLMDSIYTHDYTKKDENNSPFKF